MYFGLLNLKNVFKSSVYCTSTHKLNRENGTNVRCRFDDLYLMNFCNKIEVFNVYDKRT